MFRKTVDIFSLFILKEPVDIFKNFPKKLFKNLISELIVSFLK